MLGETDKANMGMQELEMVLHRRGMNISQRSQIRNLQNLRISECSIKDFKMA